ncbi:MAG: tetratricopeptide repeat protein [Elusimicrobiota bacterium]
MGIEKNWFLLCGIIIVTVIIYFPSLKVPFIFDDIAKIVENPDIRQLSNLKTKLFEPYTDKNRYINKNDPSRPVVSLTFTLNYYFGKLNTFGYHLFNLTVHIFNIILIFILTKKIISFFPSTLLPSTFLPLFVAFFFAVHPANTHSVTYIFSRSVLLSTLFFLLAVLLFLKYEKSHISYLLSLICFILSVFSRSDAVVLPVILLVFDYIFLSRPLRIGYHLPFWILLVLYLLFKQFYLGGIGDIEALECALPNRFVYLMLQPRAILKYLNLLLIPTGLCIDHQTYLRTFFEFRIIISWVLLICLFLLIYITYRKKTIISKITVVAGLWFFITLLPTSSFFPTTSDVEERRLYFSGYGFYLLLGLFYYFLFSRMPINWQLLIGRINSPLRVGTQTSMISCISKIGKKGIIILAGLLVVHLIALATTTYKRNQLFNQPAFLWQDVIKKYPNNPRAYYNLALINYGPSDDYKKALQLCQKAVTIRPDYAELHNTLGNIYYMRKEYEKAYQEFKKAIEIKPHLSGAHYNLAVLYQTRNDYSNAIIEYKKAIEINPYRLEAHNNLGNIYYTQKEYGNAIQEYKKVIELNPDLISARTTLAEIYYLLKEYDNALQEYQKIVEMDPSSAKAHNNLGVVYYAKGDYRNALKHYQKAIELAPDYFDALYNLSKTKLVIKKND